MKNDSINYVLVGGFVFAMLAALLFAVALLTGRAGTTDTYYTRYEDATGLKYGSQVLYMGFAVGQVEDIKPVLEAGKVVFDVEMSVNEEFSSWNVPEDSIAEVRSAGLLAAVAIDIRVGRSPRALKPGAHIPGRGQTDVFGAVQDTANTLRQLTQSSVRPLLENLNEYVSRFGDVLDRTGGPLIENLGQLSGELARQAPEIIEDFRSTTSELRGLSERLRAVLSDENTRKVGTVMDNVVLASEDLARLADNTRGQLDTWLGPAMRNRVDRFVGDAADTASEALSLSRGARSRLERVLSDDNLASVERSLANVERTTTGMSAVVSEDNLARVQRSLANAEDASAQMRALLDGKTRAALDTSLRNIESATGSLDSLITDTRSQLSRVLSEDNLARVDQSLVNVEEVAGEMRALVSEDNRSRVERSLANLEAASQDMQALVDTDTRQAVDDTLRTVHSASRGLDTLITDTRAQVAELIGPDTRARLDQALENVSMASANIAQLSTALDARLGEVLTPEMSRKLKSSLDNFARAAGSIARLSSGLIGSRQRLDALLLNLNEATTENRPGVRDSVRSMRHSLRALSQHIDSVTSNLEGASRNMFELSRRLKANPGMLLRSPLREDEAVVGRGGG